MERGTLSSRLVAGRSTRRSLDGLRLALDSVGRSGRDGAMDRAQTSSICPADPWTDLYHVVQYRWVVVRAIGGMPA